MKMAIQHIALDHSDELYCVIGFGSFFQNKLIFDDIDILFVGISNDNFQLYKTLKAKCSNLSLQFKISIDFNFLSKREYEENLYLDIKNNSYCSVHDKFHRTLILSGFCLLKIAKISLNSSFFPKPIKR